MKWLTVLGVLGALVVAPTADAHTGYLTRHDARVAIADRADNAPVMQIASFHCKRLTHTAVACRVGTVLEYTYEDGTTVDVTDWGWDVARLHGKRIKVAEDAYDDGTPPSVR